MLKRWRPQTAAYTSCFLEKPLPCNLDPLLVSIGQNVCQDLTHFRSMSIGQNLHIWGRFLENLTFDSNSTSDRNLSDVLKSIAAADGGLYVMFLGPPLPCFWIRYWFLLVKMYVKIWHTLDLCVLGQNLHKFAADGSVFPPFISQDFVATMFSMDVCR